MPRPSKQCFQFDVGAGFIPPSALEAGGSGGEKEAEPNFSIQEVCGSVVMARYTARRRGGDCSRVGSPESTSSLPADMDAATASRHLLPVDQDQATARSPSGRESPASDCGSAPAHRWAPSSAAYRTR